MIVQMAGLNGSGKSTLAAELEHVLPGQVLLLDKDQIRHTLFGPRHVEYSREQDDFCVAVMHHTAARHLATRPHRGAVILDGRTCSRAYQIQQAQQLAARTRRPLRIIECVCPDATARARLTHDAAVGSHPAANRDFQLYLRLKAAADPITAPRLRLNTEAPLTTCVAQALRYLTGTAARRPLQPFQPRETA